MTLLEAATEALAQLEHLHGPQKCLSPGNCPTLAAIQNLRQAIIYELARTGQNGWSFNAEGNPTHTITKEATLVTSYAEKRFSIQCEHCQSMDTFYIGQQSVQGQETVYIWNCHNCGDVTASHIPEENRHPEPEVTYPRGMKIEDADPGAITDAIARANPGSQPRFMPAQRLCVECDTPLHPNTPITSNRCEKCLR